jgi:hypothetical protein
MDEIKDVEERGSVAFQRLQEMLRDMEWTEDWAIEELYRTIGEKLGATKKSIEQWFGRRSIPAIHIFNVAVAFGVSSDWLAGLPGRRKVDGIVPGGLYAREVERARKRAG